MAEKSIKKNYIYNVSYQILILITPLITTPYISRVLNPDGVGTVSFVDSVVSFFTLFATLGITLYGQREISYVRDDANKRSLVFWNTKVLEFITALLALAIFFVFASTRSEAAIYYVYSFSILAVFFDVTWFFQGLEEFGKIVIRNIIFKIAGIIYIFVFVKTQDDLIKYAFGLSFFIFLSNISLWGYLRSYLVKISIRQLRPFKDMKVVLSLFLPTIAIQIYTMLDKTMIGLITKDASQNGYYEQAITISRMVLMLVTSLGTVIIPRIGYFYKKGDVESVKSLMHRSYRFVWFLALPLCAGLQTVADNFVPWFYGEKFLPVIPLLKILALIIVAIGINTATGIQYLVPTGRQNLLTITLMCGAATNFTLNMFFIRLYGAMGAAIASVIAETVIATVQLIIVRREFDFIGVLLKSYKYFISAAIMAAVLVLTGKNMASSMLNTIALVAAGAVVYFACLLILRDDFFIDNVKNVLNKIKSIRSK